MNELSPRAKRVFDLVDCLIDTMANNAETGWVEDFMATAILFKFSINATEEYISKIEDGPTAAAARGMVETMKAMVAVPLSEVETVMSQSSSIIN